MDESLNSSTLEFGDSNIAFREMDMEDQEYRSNPTPRKHLCPFCGDGFPFKSVLTRHLIKRHEPDSAPRDHVCRYCGSGFKTKMGMTLHTRHRHESNGQRECKML